MSDIKSAPHITHTVTSSGITIHINDHVYLAPEHLGEPYYIGRIMEFCTSSKRKGLQARIAWFNRPKDVINRKSADPCLLVATMHSDVNPVSSIRGKCTVTHKYYIPKDQMDAYRKEEDHFYYNQLYDRYIQRVYDVLPCEAVQNIPMDTIDALKQRYQFIVVEQGKAADLTSARRMCCVCQEWAQSALSVKCAACQKSYHMACLNPPLVKKPSKGFAWQCAFCTRQEFVNTEKSTPTPPPKEKRQTRSTRSQSTKSSPASIEKPIEISETSIKLKLNQPKKSTTSGGYKNQQIKMTHMWPFRYFGVNTNIRDILDVDDRIYPRAKSRIGAKYQAFVPDFEPSCRSLSPLSDTQSPKSKSFKKNDRKMKLNTPKQKRSADTSPSDTTQSEPFDSEPLIPTRGSDATATCLYRPGIIEDDQLDEYMDQCKSLSNLSLAPHNSDLMDRALIELETHDYDTTQALESMSNLRESDFKHVVDWTEKEIEAFEQSIREHGHDLNYAKKSVETKEMADIVRYFYQWKKTERYEPVYSEWTKVFKPTKKFKKFPSSRTDLQSAEDEHEVSESEEEEEEADPTIIPKATYAKKTYQCMNCLSDSSKIWRRSPSDIDRKRKVFHKVLCDACGIYWLKYAKTKYIPPEVKLSNAAASTAATNTPISQPSDEVEENNDKKRKRPNENSTKVVVKKVKEDKKANGQDTPEPLVCLICSSSNVPVRIYTCIDCGMSVHNDCYGIDKEQDKVEWRCDPCDNKYHPVSSYTYDCMLCFNPGKDGRRPLKKTAGYYWAHVQCATFIPEIKFVHPSLLSPVEYVGCVNVARLNANCQLCQEPRGACVACTECKKTVHVQCAIDHQFKLAFEIQPNTHNSNKLTKFPMIPFGLFGPSSPSGLMIPQVWCPHHTVSNRKLVDLHTRTNNDTQESAIMTFVKNYKCVAKGTTPAMRRLLSSKHVPSKIHHPKIPHPRDAMIEALTMDEQLVTPITTPVKPVLHNKPHPAVKRTCDSEGCFVQHTPIWWTVDNKKICQRCHKKQKV